MGELLPTLAARSIQSGLLEYLETTFGLSDETARQALREFLEHEDDGIFKGPYLRLRLPFREAADDWRDALGWHPTDDGEGFPPYGHQAAAYRRLSSLDLGPEKPRPLPTLVTTGTGSGKTEAFLHPILDHVLRAKRDGVGGTKALILYPMNALANDQAQRLAELITTHPSLSGVTAGLYTGQQGSRRTRVTADGLITDRYIMRSEAPDILLTNYKMLDQMLLRRADQPIWEQSAASLQYLVLDEFHTYDGAQGTDVAMLLRRLGLALRAHGATDTGRPLGNVTPVATSATLGDEGDPAAMLDFAETVFGEPFGPDAVVTEDRLGPEDWVGTASVPADPRECADLVEAILAALGGLGPDPQPRDLAAAVLPCLYDGPVPDDPDVVVRSHPVTRELLDHCTDAAALRDVAQKVFPGVPPPDALEALEAYVGVLSHLRARLGRSMASVELHLWIRELTRIDRLAATQPLYSWSDEGAASVADEDADSMAGGEPFPAVFCRHCGRSGWGVALSPANSTDLDTTDDDIRRNHARREGRFRPLLHATHEGDVAMEGPTAAGPDGPPQQGNLRWFHVTERQLLKAVPDAESVQAGSVLPVLTHTGPEGDDEARADHCPACGQKDGIRFLGSAVATQLSVALSTLFGSTNLEQAEKKTLVFTDSVQDAAHRAGFVQTRSHSLTVRSMLRRAVAHQPVTLDELADRVVTDAGDDAHLRFRILPPDLAERPEFAPFWQQKRLSRVPLAVRKRVRRRIAFDAVLEFGLQSRLGRTLEMTGSLAAQVDAPAATMLAAARRTAEDSGHGALFAASVDDARLLAWVRGVLERMRERGAVEHEWFHKLVQEDGNRYFIWRGRPRSEGMPAFPTGRTAPAFPRIGKAPGGARENVLDQVATPQSWYTQWTLRCLGVNRSEAPSLARQLLKRLASMDLLRSTSNKAGAEVFAIPQGAVLITPVDDADLRGARNLLVCEVCQAQVPGTAEVVDQLDGAPCTVSRCHGTLARAPGRPDNFYRRFFDSHELQRVIAREHTSLLEDEVRLEYENGFKGRLDDPAAPNVLVATPTLEMGIDIGALSTVMLASLPRTVSSYLQRVGRAGRLSGSALDLAFVSGRGEHLPRLGEPLSMINGRVRPPATYLSAEEILRRQYVASLSDRQARDPEGVHPTSATGAMEPLKPDSYLHALARDAETSPEHLNAFLAGFPSLSEDVRENLRAWVRRRGDVDLTSPVAERLIVASQRWAKDVERLSHRIVAIEAELPGLKQTAELSAASDDDKHAYRTAEASLRLAKRQRADLQGDYWVGVLEKAGVLPNYTLLDDSVILDVGLSWMDPESGEYETQPLDYQRNAALALREFAPGATFYAGGHRVRVDAVDLGTKSEDVRSLALCPACGHHADTTANPAPSTCPRCGAGGIADVSQRLAAVELVRSSSSMRRDEAAIGDDRDERIQESFELQTLADVDPANVTRQWFVKDHGFGAKHLRSVRLTWLNLGRTGRSGSPRTIAGGEHRPELFRVCSECGQLDRQSGRNSRHEHRAWCRLRNAEVEDATMLALTRTLETEGLLLRLPPLVALGNSYAVPSLATAIQLGLREELGGTPDHLAMERVVDPVPEADRDNHDALLIHDTVPGGTGYLADLATPEVLRRVLHTAWTIVRDCTCADQGRLACHHCLLPFAGARAARSVSRAEAERLLADILHGGATNEEPTADGGWQLTEVATEAFDPESKLEQRFRAELKKRLATLGAAVQEKPGGDGIRLEITLGGRRWSLDPQVLVLNSKPDFVLKCSDPNVPRLAIFCDGWKYHASPVHNNLAADAEKRRLLRDSGLLVLNVSWKDLQDGEVPVPWFTQGIVHAIVQQTGLKPDEVRLMQKGPLDLLMAWIQDPDTTWWRRMGDTVPLFTAAVAQTKGKHGQRADLASSAVHVLDGHPLGDSGAATWVWGHDTLALAARQNSKAGVLETALVLDDDEAALGVEHREAWETWLRLANLLGARATHSQVSVRSAAGAEAPTTDEPATAPTGPRLDVVWQAVQDEALEEEKAFVVELAGSGVPTPVVGEEIDGIPVSFSWPDVKVLVGSDLDPAERDEVEQAGWTVTAMDVDAVAAALKGAQG